MMVEQITIYSIDAVFIWAFYYVCSACQCTTHLKFSAGIFIAEKVVNTDKYAVAATAVATIKTRNH